MSDCPSCKRPLKIQQPLDFCDRCGCSYVLCSSSHINKISDVFCQVCNIPIQAKAQLINEYQARFSSENRTSAKHSFKKSIPINRLEAEGVKLVSINENLLVFTHKSSRGYKQIYLIHPFLDSEPIALHSLISDQDFFSGSAIATNEYLFLGSQQNLFQISIPSISISEPGSLEIKKHDISAENLIYISEDMLLVHHQSKTENVPCISIRNVSNLEQIIDQVDEEWEHVQIHKDIMLLTQGHQISFIEMDPESLKFGKRKDTGLAQSHQIITPLCFVGNTLRFVASDIRDQIFMKWQLDHKHFPITAQPELILRDKQLLNVDRVMEDYLLLFDNAVSSKDQSFDRELYHINFGREIIPVDIGISICNVLMAVTLKNPLSGTSCISVINGNNGNYIMSTDPFQKIFPSPIQWGRHLLVLAQGMDDSEIRVYGFDVVKK